MTATAIRGIYGVGNALRPRAESALLEWIPLNNPPCAVRLNGVTKLNAHRQRKRRLFVISAYAPTDVASEAEKDSFYRELTRLVRCAKSTAAVAKRLDLNVVRRFVCLRNPLSYTGGCS